MTCDPSGRTITALDVHSHHLSTDVVDPSGEGPRLVVDDANQGRIVQGAGSGGGRDVPATLWSVERRLAEMDRVGVSHQVISPVPAVMEHAWLAGPGHAHLANASIAAACQESGGRLIGLGCLPLHGWQEELERCVAFGLRGIEVGTRQGDLDLDAPELDEVWRACEDSDLCVFVHPVAGGHGVVRRADPRIDIGIGMLTDTALAASALVFGGVLASRPRLRVVLAHGCGAFPWVYPRLRDLGGRGVPAEAWDKVVRRLYADTLVLDVEHVRLLTHHLGPERLVLGSDSPYMPDQLAGLVESVDAAIAAGAVNSAARDNLLLGNALELLGLTEWLSSGTRST